MSESLDTNSPLKSNLACFPVLRVKSHILLIIPPYRTVLSDAYLRSMFLNDHKEKSLATFYLRVKVLKGRGVMKSSQIYENRQASFIKTIQ